MFLISQKMEDYFENKPKAQSTLSAGSLCPRKEAFRFLSPKHRYHQSSLLLGLNIYLGCSPFASFAQCILTATVLPPPAKPVMSSGPNFGASSKSQWCVTLACQLFLPNPSFMLSRGQKISAPYWCLDQGVEQAAHYCECGGEHT